MTTNTLKISIAAISNPICVLIFLLNTNLWICGRKGEEYCTTLFANSVSQETVSADITRAPPEVHKPAQH